MTMIAELPYSVILSELLPKLDSNDKLSLSQTCTNLRNIVPKKSLYKTLWINLWNNIHTDIVNLNYDMNKNGKLYKMWVDTQYMKISVHMETDSSFTINHFKSNDSLCCPVANFLLNITYTENCVAKSFEINIDKNFNLTKLNTFSNKLYFIALKNLNTIYSIKNKIYVLNEIGKKYNL